MNINIVVIQVLFVSLCVKLYNFIYNITIIQYNQKLNSYNFQKKLEDRIKKLVYINT